MSLVDKSKYQVFAISYKILMLLLHVLVIAERNANPIDKKDLLYTMLEGKDPQTGKGLSLENIRNNVSATPTISKINNNLPFDSSY